MSAREHPAQLRAQAQETWRPIFHEELRLFESEAAGADGGASSWRLTRDCCGAAAHSEATTLGEATTFTHETSRLVGWLHGACGRGDWHGGP